MVRLAVEVALASYRAVVLALWILQLEAHPLSVLEGHIADEAHGAYTPVSYLHFLPYAEGHFRELFEALALYI